MAFPICCNGTPLIDGSVPALTVCHPPARSSLPVTALVDQFYADVQQMGGGRWDTSSLLKRLQAMG